MSEDVNIGAGIDLKGKGFDPTGVVRVELQRVNVAPIELGSVHPRLQVAGAILFQFREHECAQHRPDA